MSINKSVVQSMMSRNRDEIRHVERVVADYRISKREADESGETHLEFICHNELVYWRGQLKKLVASQKLLKEIMKM